MFCFLLNTVSLSADYMYFKLLPLLSIGKSPLSLSKIEDNISLNVTFIVIFKLHRDEKFHKPQARTR